LSYWPVPFGKVRSLKPDVRSRDSTLSFRTSRFWLLTSAFLTSTPCAPCASGKSDSTCSARAARSSCAGSSSCCSSGVCTRCTPR